MDMSVRVNVLKSESPDKKKKVDINCNGKYDLVTP